MPPPDAHETAYYAPTAGIAERLIEPLRRLAEADRLRAVRSLRPDARVLEIGSGDGRFLDRLRRRGADVVGIEPSAAGRARSEARGIAASAAGVEAFAPPADAFDAVIAWHALEHLDEPAEALRRARDWVRPGGLLVVAVPNRDSLQARIGGDRWFHQDVPRHRTHFTTAGAEAIVERTGFGIERVRHLVVEQNALGMWQTLLNRLTSGRDVAYRALKRDPTVRRGPAGDLVVTAIAAAPLAAVAVALELAAGIARRGGTFVIEARAR